MQTAATPLKAAANLLRWGFGLGRSPTNRTEAPPKEKESPPPPGVVSPSFEGRGEGKEGDKGGSPLAEEPAAYDLAGRRKSLPAFGGAEHQPPPPSFTDKLGLAGGAQPVGGGGQAAKLQAPVPDARDMMSPYQRRKTISGSEFNLHGQPSARRSESREAGYLGSDYSHAVNNSVPRNPYENVKAILRQGREHRSSSVVDRYYSQQRQYADQYQSYAGESRRSSMGHQGTPTAARSYGYGMERGATPASTSAMRVFMGHSLTPPEEPFDAPSHANGERGMMMLAQGRASNGGEIAAMGQEERRTSGEGNRTSPVHAFKRRSSWTPMRPSSTASRLKTLKRSFVSSQSQQEQEGSNLDNEFKSPTKRMRASPMPVFTRSNLVTPGDRLRRESQDSLKAKTPKSAQLTTETAKRILSTLDSLTSPGSGKKEESAIPQKLKFNLPEADLGSLSPPPVDSLRHFSQPKQEKKKETSSTASPASKATATSGKKWPASFLAKNKAMGDKAVESVEKEIEAAKGGLPKDSTPSKKAPTFTFGDQTKTVGHVHAPPSPVFGLQGAGGIGKEAKKSGFQFNFGSGAPETTAFTFGGAAKPAPKGANKERTYSFGDSKLSENEKAFAEAIEGGNGGVLQSNRSFSFGETKGVSEDGNRTSSDLLKEANKKAVAAASVPLPADGQEDTAIGGSPTPATPAVKAWPASFLAKNKKDNDSAVAAVAEEIEKAKNPAPAVSLAKPGAPTFTFGSAPSKDDAEKDAEKPKFTFGAAPLGGDNDTKKTDLFSFGSTPKASTPASDKKLPSFSFGATATDKEAEKPKEQSTFKAGNFAFGASSSSIAASSTPSFVFGKQGNDDSAPLNKQKRKAEDDAPAAKKPFAFGSTDSPAITKPKESVPSAGAANLSSPFAFGSSTPAKQTPFGFPPAASTEKKEEEKEEPFSKPKSSAPVFAFGASASQPSQASFASPSPSPFGKPADAKEKPAEPAAPSPFSFTASASSAQATKAAEAPALGGFSSASSGGAFQFGATSTPQFSAGPQSTSGSTDAPFAFGSTATADKKESNQPSFSFGAGAPSPFGSQSQAAPPTPSAFGGSNLSSSAPAFAFGSSKPSESKPDAPFGSPGGFGSSGPAPASTPSFGGFGSSGPSAGAFGTPAPASTTAAQSPFTFGASQPATQAVTPAFGSVASAPAFGSGAPAPAFGSSGGAQPAGFGAPPSPASGGFGFGASQPQPAFGGPAASPAPAPAFGAQMPAQQSTAFGGFQSPMPNAGGQGGAPGAFSMGISSNATPQSGRRKVKAKPSWRKK
ncbi:hypothetical protein A3770_01p06280 [Chloropicon primus]|uniref:Uncharacterized protein n=2 Tax=Chloropicon primus TaxID=1764295 RepID=A0A5B8MFK7_9CHLO|nr:hypothetical protein A3770_01p06280 [Chloropicon primus]|eukprot:QDZ18110.1 hypothetical protein A3770_01p06280 [Chloropicon primus]